MQELSVSQAKITVVGAGNVGATAAHIAASKGLGDVVLLDIVEGLPEGKALDMAQAKGVYASAGNLTGTTDWDKAANSDIVIVTSGLPRKPGMSRDDLLAKNAGIVKAVTEQIVRTSPNSFIVVVCNPLDVMTQVAATVSGFDKNKVMGMAGALDSARFACFIAEELNCDIADIRGVLMGGHGDDMVPLPRFTSIAGIPLTELMARDRIDIHIQRARKGGIEIVNLMGSSAYYAPAAGAVKMAEAILKDTKSIVSCCAYCDSEYGIGGAFVGVPAMLGENGVEKIIQLDLNETEKAELVASVNHVKELVSVVETMI
ncbi:MAG: malate dehydrogenase [Planctomycetales bacterium 4572_13]|nr:MAG: malate dehydrogenase [Planctomycetales bacterium 4572_13]